MTRTYAEVVGGSEGSDAEDGSSKPAALSSEEIRPRRTQRPSRPLGWKKAAEKQEKEKELDAQSKMADREKKKGKKSNSAKKKTSEKRKRVETDEELERPHTPTSNHSRQTKKTKAPVTSGVAELVSMQRKMAEMQGRSPYQMCARL